MRVIDFYSENCGPCRLMSGVIDELSAELQDVYFEKVSLTTFPDKIQEYSIRTVPSFVVTNDNGATLGVKAGACSKQVLRDFINQFKE